MEDQASHFKKKNGKAPRASPGISTFICFALLAAGVGILVWNGLLVYRGIASRGWPSVEGKIISSEFSRDVGEDQATAKIEYFYTVQGSAHTSSNVSFDIELVPESRSSKYPRGKEVTVYYDPENPEVAALEPGVSISSFIPLLLGLPFFAIGLAGFILGIRPDKKE